MEAADNLAKLCVWAQWLQMKELNSADLFAADENSWRQEFRPTPSRSKSRGEMVPTGIYVDQTSLLQQKTWCIRDSVGGFTDQLGTGYWGRRA